MSIDKKEGASRREFLTGAVAATAAAATIKTAQAQPSAVKRILPSTILGANEKIRTGHIGLGGMGGADLGFVMEREDMQPIALCDLYPKKLGIAAKRVKQKYENFTEHHDFREVIDNKDVDAVVIATPDHWHCLVTMFAADAKKNIYCEKPASTTVAECQAMLKAVRENKIIFQAGNMQRSGEHFQEAVKLVQDGYLGKVARVEAYIHDSEDLNGIGMGEDDEAKWKAAGLDWEFHQGWVEHKPFNTNRWIYNWRWFLEYSGGKITDWGAHLVDIALWGMGEDKKPKTVTAQGRKFLMQDNRTTPDTLEVLWEFDDYILSFSNRVWNSFVPKGFTDHGIVFHGTLGTMFVSRGGYKIFSVANNKGCEEKSRGESILNEAHWENFAQCIRSGKDPISSIDVITNTTTTCHLGTAAYVTGARLTWDAATQKFTGADEATKKANDWIYRPYLNGWSLEKPYRKA